MHFFAGLGSFMGLIPKLENLLWPGKVGMLLFPAGASRRSAFSVADIRARKRDIYEIQIGPI
jgi:hypothetical protein